MANKTDKAIYVDTSLCTGCKACQVACKEWHNLPATEFEKVPGTYQNPADRSFNTLMLMKFQETKSTNAAEPISWLIRKDQCMHCSNAPCVEVCPPHALYQHDTGFVGLDRDKCIGCSYCAKVCPFDIPRYDSNAFGTTKMNKCDFCQDRVTNGKMPACVQTCPTRALQTMSWDEAVKTAKSRVQQIKDRYPNANVYGDHVMGGTHYIYVLTEAPEHYGLPANPQSNELIGFRNDVLKPISKILFGGVGAGLLVNLVVSSLHVKGDDEKGEDKHE